jgi:hypothetical protein
MHSEHVKRRAGDVEQGEARERGQERLVVVAVEVDAGVAGAACVLIGQRSVWAGPSISVSSGSSVSPRTHSGRLRRI